MIVNCGNWVNFDDSAGGPAPAQTTSEPFSVRSIRRPIYEASSKINSQLTIVSLQTNIYMCYLSLLLATSICILKYVSFKVHFHLCEDFSGYLLLFLCNK